MLVGPWTGEVGFELIYWIPFVRWALGHAAIDPARLSALSRGGAAPWYAGMAGNYVDVLDFTTIDEFRTRTAISRKQRGLTAFDRDLLRRARRGSGGDAALIHPAMMYALFYPYWRQDAPLSRVLAYARFCRYSPVPRGAADAPLPDDYVAARFYFSDCFPNTPENQRFVADTLHALAEHRDVVVLRAGVGLDDHADALVEGRHRIHVVDAAKSPRDNLAIQTAVISRARAFIGTYGGFSYLAPLYGVDSVAFHSVRNFQESHLEAAQYIVRSVDGGSLTPLDVRRADVVNMATSAGRPANAVASRPG